MWEVLTGRPSGPRAGPASSSASEMVFCPYSPALACVRDTDGTGVAAFNTPGQAVNVLGPMFCACTACSACCMTARPGSCNSKQYRNDSAQGKQRRQLGAAHQRRPAVPLPGAAATPGPRGRPPGRRLQPPSAAPCPQGLGPESSGVNEEGGDLCFRSCLHCGGARDTVQADLTISMGWRTDSNGSAACCLHQTARQRQGISHLAGGTSRVASRRSAPRWRSGSRCCAL